MNDFSLSALLSDPDLLNTSVTAKGWVKTRRDSKAGVSFIQLHDGSCFDAVQVVAPNSLPNYNNEVLKLTAGCAIIITGTLIESPAKGQLVEIQAKNVEVVGWVDEPETYPIQPKRHTMEFLREVAHLRPRTNTFAAVARVRHHLSQAIHQFFHQRGFYWVHTPIITASDCEGAGELFRVSTLDLHNPKRTDTGQIDFGEDFFGKEAFLTVSGQLNVEAYALALSKVYTFGPTFRAENSNTSRHLAEFWMVEPEVAFANLEDIATLAESMLKTLCTQILDECHAEMTFFNKWIDKTCLERIEKMTTSQFAQIEYNEAIDILERSNQKFTFPVKWGLDLQSEHERYLAEKHVGRPLVIKNYPKAIKGFYMRLNDDNQTVAAMDVIAPGIGEIIGGSQREERLDVLDQRLDELELNKETYNWYRDLRRYGSVPHAGFGLGFARLISYLTGMKNVRDVIPFPRTPGNAAF